MNGPDWITLPSLSGLRAFEAAARLGGFSAAARALNVTHAAIAQQVRALERELGEALVYRDGRALSLTEKGRALSAELTNGFLAIQAAVETTRARPDRPVAISLSPSFAANWLMPRLARFSRIHPEIQVTLSPDHRLADLAREGFDFAIRFGRGAWPGVQAEFLTTARYVIVATPELMAGRATLDRDEVAKMPVILEQDWPEHRHWLSSQLGLDLGTLTIREFATEELALGAARQGLGLHVISRALVEEDVQQGRLQIAFEGNDEGPAYYIVTPPGVIRRPARQFIKWLKTSV